MKNQRVRPNVSGTIAIHSFSILDPGFERKEERPVDAEPRGADQDLVLVMNRAGDQPEIKRKAEEIFGEYTGLAATYLIESEDKDTLYQQQTT